MIYYVMGVTCAGKDTMMETAQKMFPNLVGLVQVGKEFRRRYPPERFRGLAAMPDTEAEALQIFEDQLKAASDKKTVFVSGQPRLLSQIPTTIDKHPGTVLWMHCPQELIDERLSKRFGDDVAACELSHKRLTSDRILLYDTIHRLMVKGYPIMHHESDNSNNYEALINLLVYNDVP